MSRRPRFGPVRKQIWDTAKAAENAVHTTSNTATRSILQLTTAGLKLLATATEFIEEAADGEVEIRVRTENAPFIGNLDIPIYLSIRWNTEEDQQ